MGESAVGEFTLRRAAEAGDVYTVRELLDAGVDPNARDEWGISALHLAVIREEDSPHKDYLALVQALLEAGADPEARAANGQTPLVSAAATGLDGVVAYLLDEAGADLNATLGSGANALHVLIDDLVAWDEGAAGEEAASEDAQRIYDAYLRTARLLIDRGIDLSAALEDSGQTPLFSAAAYGLDDIVSAILSRSDAAVDARDAYGLTPLAYAARSGAASTVRLLLGAGADPNAQDHHGFAPLHHAAVSGDLETVQALVEGGARTNLRLTQAYGSYPKGSTALDLARQARQRTVAGYLSRPGS